MSPGKEHIPGGAMDVNIPLRDGVLGHFWSRKILVFKTSFSPSLPSRVKPFHCPFDINNWRWSLLINMRRLFFALAILYIFFLLFGSCDVTCDEHKPCQLGCCSKSLRICGYGPSYCAAEKCVPEASANGTCAQKSECDPGVYPGWGEVWGKSFSMIKIISWCPIRFLTIDSQVRTTHKQKCAR